MEVLKISQIRLPLGHTEEMLRERIRRILKLKPDAAFSYRIVKKSIDARKKPALYEVYAVHVDLPEAEALVRRLGSPSVSMEEVRPYTYPAMGEESLQGSPLIVGAGPAGLFAAYQLADAGYAPVIIERGRRVEERIGDVARFWESGQLDPDSNVQFGEGGAGTFSDGKLNTAVRDSMGRNDFVLECFVRFGAPERILYENRPHIGTDVLQAVIRNMRDFLEKKGAVFYFQTRMTELIIERGRCAGVRCQVRTAEGIQEIAIPAQAVILAPGHSARDTFYTLKEQGVPMEPKSFAVGFRMEHPQAMIDAAMYGADASRLPAAPYKLTSNFPNGRGVYSFCMCPGGYVVNASSEAGGTVVNGMSYSGRHGANANSAIIVSVTPADYPGDDILAGVRYQRKLEQRACRLGGGKIPQQLYGDYLNNTASTAYGGFASQTKGGTVFANLRGLLSQELERSLMDGMSHFARIIADFDRKDTILSGMETRTSSPVRILRGARGESALEGLYPCGEGAGYAGGIMSAAIDGLKAASCVMGRFRPAD